MGKGEHDPEVRVILAVHHVPEVVAEHRRHHHERRVVPVPNFPAMMSGTNGEPSSRSSMVSADAVATVTWVRPWSFIPSFVAGDVVCHPPAGLHFGIARSGVPTSFLPGAFGRGGVR